MKQELITKISFEEAVCQEDNIEYWMARDLQVLLDYTEWRNFLQVVEKAKVSCQKAGQHVFDHFVDVNKMVQIASGIE